MPNFLIIGAPKSGTTSLYAYLSQHPMIYMSPNKEPHFFAFEGQPPQTAGPGDTLHTAITDREKYERLFDGRRKERAVGEASTLYLYIPATAACIRSHIPDARLIAILRNPIERAFSAFLHLHRQRRETCRSFADALEDEPKRIEQNWGPLWHYTRVGLYHGQMQRYFEYFGPRQIRCLLYEDLQADATAVTRDIYRFLDVDDSFEPDVSRHYNVSRNVRVVRNPWLAQLRMTKSPIVTAARRIVPGPARRRLAKFIEQRGFQTPELTPCARQRLAEFFREDVTRLQELIHRDLSHWLQ